MKTDAAKKPTKGAKQGSEDATRSRRRTRSKAAVRLITTELSDLVRETGPWLTGPFHAANYLSQLIGAKDREHFVVLHLNTKLAITGVETVSIGSLSAALVHPREVFKAAILANSRGIICGHNHPAGDTTPSDEDRAIYARLDEAGKLLGVEVLDFLIVTRNGEHHSLKGSL